MFSKSNNTVLRLLVLVGPLSGYMCLAVLFGTLGSLCAIGVPVFGTLALLAAAGVSEQLPFLPLVTTLAACGLLRGVLHYAEQYLNHLIAFKLLAVIRQKVFAALCELAPAKLEGRDKGDLIAMITTDVELIEVFYAHTISPVLIATFVSLTMFVCVSLINPLLGVVAALAYVAVGLIIPLIISGRSGRAGREYRDQAGVLNSYVLDSLRGIKQSIQYGNGAARLQQIQSYTDSLAKKQGVLKAAEGRAAAATTMSVVLFSALMLTVSVLLFTAGEITASGAVIATVMMLSSFGPVIALASLPGNLTYTFAAANRIFELMEEQPAVREITDGIDLPFNGMRMHDVNFSYTVTGHSHSHGHSHGHSHSHEVNPAHSNTPTKILTDFNMPIPPGQIVGVTGKSGSGKSTALRLLMRFWDTTGGEVLFSEQNISNINTSNLRQSQSYMTQETQLFAGSILSNILIANANATEQDVKAACQKASIDDFISALPNGYDTQIGELGSRLSDGEKQRIGLARAFLHDAPMILLDEPTSNLDSLNEAVIMQSLYQTAKQKTVVLVSHRESTMRIANKVYTVQNGRLS